MIRHCVFIRFKSGTGDDLKREIYEGLAGLQDHHPGFLGIEYGPNVSPEGMDQGHSEGFIINFTDASARDAYLVDEEHQRIGAKLVAAADGGKAGILVFDLEVTASAEETEL